MLPNHHGCPGERHTHLKAALPGTYDFSVAQSLQGWDAVSAGRWPSFSDAAKGRVGKRGQILCVAAKSQPSKGWATEKREAETALVQRPAFS
ncbi:MAG TPA: hypothetical protein VIK18_04610 [Pirellulales bacterium]